MNSSDERGEMGVGTFWVIVIPIFILLTSLSHWTGADRPTGNYHSSYNEEPYDPAFPWRAGVGEPLDRALRSRRAYGRASGGEGMSVGRKKKWSHLKEAMGGSLIRGPSTRRRYWRVEDKEQQPVRTGTIEEFEKRREAEATERREEP